MPTFTGTIQELVSGDFRQIPFQITNIPTNGAMDKGWLTVKESAADLDVNAIFMKEITTVLDTNEGHITNDGAIGNVATGFFNLLSTDTILLVPEQPYVYDIQIRVLMTDATTRISTVEIGTVTSIDGVTDTTT
jgi:hypothetical protein